MIAGIVSNRRRIQIKATGVVDNLNTGFQILEGFLTTNTNPFDLMNTGFVVDSGEFPLIVNYVNSTAPTELLNTGFVVDSGEFPLIVNYVNSTAPTELLNTGFVVDSGTLT